jgi:alpha-glucosidase
MYLDDGESRSSADSKAHPIKYGGDIMAKSEYRKTRITHEYVNKTKRMINVKRIHDGYTPRFETWFYVAVLHDPSEKSGPLGCLKRVSIERQLAEPLVAGTLEERNNAFVASSNNSWYHNESNNISYIKVFDSDPDITIALEYLS